MKKFACAFTDWFAKPLIIFLFLLCSTAWLLSGIGKEMFLGIISIFAITVTQLVLLSSDIDTKAIQEKLDELIHAIDSADDSKAGIENAEK